VLRFLPDGLPDNTFGSEGKVITGMNTIEGYSNVGVAPDGKIVAC
jgi:hypothetical protein